MKHLRRRRSRRFVLGLPRGLRWPVRAGAGIAAGAATLTLFALLALPAAALAWVPADDAIAPGVTVGGVAVGGLDRDAAGAAVRSAYDVDVSVTLAGATYVHRASLAGQALALTPALDAAWAVGRDGAPLPTNAAVDLTVQVNAVRLDNWLDAIATATHAVPRNATYRLRNRRPHLIAERPGRELRVAVLRAALKTLLVREGTGPRTLGRRPDALRTIAPAVTRRTLGPVLVVDRSARTVTVWSPRRKLHVYRIAVGGPSYPTPLGDFSVVTKQKNPTWTPPDSAWAAGESAIGPGPGNPLGTRWIGLSAAGVGFHGTPNEGSVGTAASHGCMRMYRHDVEQLFGIVRVGTPVHIRA